MTDKFLEPLVISYVDFLVKEHLEYAEELEDIWLSHSVEVIRRLHNPNLSKEKLKGDCDDFTITAIDLAFHFGVERSSLGRAIVWAYPDGIKDDSKRVGHTVALYKDSEDRVWYFGDTFGPMCLITDRNHDIQMVNWLRDRKKWIIQNDR
jgi:hypothetical protein